MEFPPYPEGGRALRTWEAICQGGYKASQLHRYASACGQYGAVFCAEGHRGIFVDNDGSRTEVHPGDVCVIEPGQSHSMENNTDEDFEMMALIYNEAAK